MVISIGMRLMRMFMIDMAPAVVMLRIIMTDIAAMRL
jgi:hypothetical protein